jgi:hypothetical protein
MSGFYLDKTVATILFVIFAIIFLGVSVIFTFPVAYGLAYFMSIVWWSFKFKLLWGFCSLGMFAVIISGIMDK